MNKQKKFILAGIVIVAAALVLAFSLSRRYEKQPQQETAEALLSAAPKAALVLPTPADEPEQPEENRTQEIDFETLKARNDDVIAWLRLPATVIDYPVVRGRDNAYYLTHNEWREYYVGGAIFNDMDNSDDFSDPVTVMYGHFMPDESLFTQLHKYKDKDFFEQNREVIVFLPDVKKEYEVVAGVIIGEERLLYNRDYNNHADMQLFLNKLASGGAGGIDSANLALDDAGLDDKYIVMSTCKSLTDNSGRYILVAKLVKETELEPWSGQQQDPLKPLQDVMRRIFGM